MQFRLHCEGRGAKLVCDLLVTFVFAILHHEDSLIVNRELSDGGAHEFFALLANKPVERLLRRAFFGRVC